MIVNVTDYLKECQAQSPPELINQWEEIEQLHTNKLWHQLTTVLTQFVKNERFQQGAELLDLYNNFISEFENKINPLSLVEILCPYVVRQFTDHKEALEFLEKLKEKTKASDEANILCSTSIGNIYLLKQDYAQAKEIRLLYDVFEKFNTTFGLFTVGDQKVIEESQEKLDAQPGVTTVHSRFYELCSNYHQYMSNHNEYYKDALRYLGCVELDTIPEAEQQERAFNLGLAGLLGSKIFNFGELLQHPVLDSLKNTPRQWLIDLLYAFNSGDIAKMNNLKVCWTAQPDLVHNEPKLRQKIRLLCLMEMTFARPATNRHIDFSEIAAQTSIPINEVELLTMKAMSLGLVRGTIDQVEQKVHMLWVQPRVLDKNQVAKIKSKLDTWCLDVGSMEAVIADKAEDILT